MIVALKCKSPVWFKVDLCGSTFADLCAPVFDPAWIGKLSSGEFKAVWLDVIKVLNGHVRCDYFYLYQIPNFVGTEKNPLFDLCSITAAQAYRRRLEPTGTNLHGRRSQQNLQQTRGANSKNLVKSVRFLLAKLKTKKR